MEEKKKKSKVKIILGIIVAIILVGVIIFGFEYYRVLQYHREFNLLDKNQFVVYHTKVENNNGKKIKIPVVNLDYPGIQQLNNEIVDTLKKYDVNDLAEQLMPYEEDGIIELVIIFKENDDTKFLVYHVDIEKGKIIRDTNELFDMLYIDKENYIKQYKETFSKALTEKYFIGDHSNNNISINMTDEQILNMPFSLCVKGAAFGYYQDERGTIYNKLLQLDDFSLHSSILKFSYNDLIVDNLKYGLSQEQVKQIMGQPDEIIDSSVSTDIYGKSITYKYSDLNLVFYNHDGKLLLSQASTESPNYTFARNLKVGDTKEKVLNSFYKDNSYENSLRDIISSDSGESYGKYLYGYLLEDYIINPVDENNNIEYGFINYYGYNPDDPTSDYMIIYEYAQPPYMLHSDDPYNVNSSLIFDMNSDDIVTGIRWYFNPKTLD